LNRNRESFTDIVTRGNVAWVMEKQKNAYEYFVSIGVNTFQARMISNVQVEHNFEVDRNQNVIIGVKTFLQSFDQHLKFDQFVTISNPLSGGKDRVKITDKGTHWEAEFHHENSSGLIEYSRYEIKGQKLVITRNTNQKPNVTGIWTFKMKKPIRSDSSVNLRISESSPLSPDLTSGCIGGAIRDGMRGCKLED